MRKKCERCEELPKLEDKEVKAIFTCEAEVLISKLEKILESTGIQSEKDEGILIVNSILPKILFEKLLQYKLTLEEQRDIKIALLDPEEPVSLKVLKRLKSLFIYLEIYRNKEIFDIFKENSFVIYFHPIIDVIERKIFGYECLMRGVKKSGEIVSPKVIFDFAEATDLVFYLDRTCRELSVETSAKYLSHFNGSTKIFINFVPTSIYDPRYCLATTLGKAYENNVNPSNLVFEVVESYKVHDLKHLKDILDYYRENGFKVALDDVGSGFSNLEALVTLRPDYIKIDKELVRDIHEDQIKQSVCRALVTIAKENNLEILAEGVEKREEYEFLKNSGIKLMQGFYFAKPSPEMQKIIQESLF